MDRPSRPGGIQLEMVGLARQTARRSVRQVANPQIAQGLEHDLGAVGRGARPADHLDVEPVGRDLDGEAHGLGHPAGVGDVEGDVADRVRGHVDAVDLAARPEDDGPVVGRPAHGRIDAVNGPGLLKVAVQAVIDRRLAAGLQIKNVEHRLVPDPPDEGQGASVGRRRRADRPAGTRDELLGLAGLTVEAPDHIDLAVRVLGVFKHPARRGVVAVIQIAAVGREGGFARILLLRPTLGHLHAAAARTVEQPHLARAQRPGRGEMLAADDELAVRRPFGLVDQAEGLGRDGLGVRAVAVHHPDVVAAAPVGGEGDAAAVGRIARLHVPGDAAGDGARLAAADRHDIDVAQQVEDDLLAVRADVDRHPGALGDVQAGVMVRAGRVLDIPFRLFGCSRCSGRGRGRGRSRSRSVLGGRDDGLGGRGRGRLRQGRKGDDHGGRGQQDVLVHVFPRLCRGRCSRLVPAWRPRRAMLRCADRARGSAPRSRAALRPAADRAASGRRPASARICSPPGDRLRRGESPARRERRPSRRR